MDFSLRLEGLIQESGLRQKDISEKLHMAPTTFNGYVKNYREPDISTLTRIAAYFDVSVDYLLGLSELRRPIVPELTESEGTMIQVYRCLLPDRRELMIELGKTMNQFDEQHRKERARERNRIRKENDN